jgi:hypothetical protein
MKYVLVPFFKGNSKPVSVFVLTSAGFTYKLDKLKLRASKYRGPPAKVYNIFNTYWTFTFMLS